MCSSGISGAIGVALGLVLALKAEVVLGFITSAAQAFSKLKRSARARRCAWLFHGFGLNSLCMTGMGASACPFWPDGGAGHPSCRGEWRRAAQAAGGIRLILDLSFSKSIVS